MSFQAMTGQHAGAYLRKLMQKSCVCIPGAFNPMVGRMCADMGFETVYLSGGALSAVHGVPDIGLVSLDTFAHTIKEITTASGLPVFADADTGFGELEMVAKTIYEYNNAGAACLHIEDQEFPKKCGHLEGKILVEAETFCEKLRMAIYARNNCCPNKELIICARTDANAVEGFNSAIKRAQMYCEAGADMIFPEGLHSEEQFSEFAKAMKSSPGEAPDGGPYLVANMTEFGKTPPIAVNTFQAMGYHAVIFPVSTLRVAMKAIEGFLGELKTKGMVDHDCMAKMYTRKELYKTLHYDTSKTWFYPSPSKNYK